MNSQMARQMDDTIDDNIRLNSKPKSNNTNYLLDMGELTLEYISNYSA